MVARLSLGSSPAAAGSPARAPPFLSPDPLRHHNPRNEQIAAHVRASKNAETPKHADSHKSGLTSLGETAILEIEGMDLSTYQNLKHAFDILVAAYRAQCANFEAKELRWSMERKESQAGEANLMEALQAVRDALEAETRAHDTDLETLEALTIRNAELEEEIRSLRMHSHAPHVGDGHVYSETIELNGLRSILRAPLSPTHADRKEHPSNTHVLGKQSYCADTDSYCLLKSETLITRQELQQSTEHLARELYELRRTNADLCCEFRGREDAKEKLLLDGKGGREDTTQLSPAAMSKPRLVARH
ncbi:hypothetical protein GUITHDRAFT_100981 [Guillardia theta CCMP2712]|uniref:Uncharacterized protein n=1 Tax=Guillardia theta (strain CCMP2712) TaxID=905079 RepID=L1JXJ3_GUITC|nr:hypothetical protein GUITHDRAFT_100981 [Guillardia theta CCMP2712]EKX53276.1 hypothetical protein GUITHDRAFT_100981 [Guillardia theta CCMP2712]|eukprot:XP_005840256.1 hypothetical protein GUITHDRAFT_100981 [Guillardia theta CCMP2712]